ncbi:MAG TPA: NTP transferase domain-containing protein [Candidatus Paceibacterota bacterium]|nr:NTP transferase domain-containing protein [Candidatus Paceibacterota bacterium]
MTEKDKTSAPDAGARGKISIIILAAGKGKRMKSDIPKALTMFKNKPFIRHILDTIKQFDPKIKPIIVVGYKSELIKEALGSEHIYAEQTKQLGTGHAVKSAQREFDQDHEIVLVLSADQPLTSCETLERIISTHQKRRGAITLATAVVPDFDKWRKRLIYLGRIVRGDDGLVKKIIEFKDASVREKKIKELNLSLYAFDANWLWNNLNKIKNENAQAEYYLTDLVKIAHDQNMKVEAVPVKNIIETIHPNSKEELETLEKLVE